MLARRDLYGAMFQDVLFPLWEGVVRKRPTLDYLRFLEQTQWRSLDELEAIQTGELSKLLRHAYEHVPFHRARFDRAGVRPEEIRSPADLCQLPITTRDDLRDALELRWSTAPPFPSVMKTTGGTTGVSLSFGYDDGSERWRQAIKMRGFGWAGYRVGDRSLHFWGFGTAKPSRFKKFKAQADHWIRREHYIDCGIRSDEHLATVVAAIRADKPQAILCYTQAGADLARYIVQRGARDWDTIPVLCGAERLFPDDRKVMQEAFGPAVFETYGCRETMLVASECEAHDGLHLSMENLCVELIVRDDDGHERPAAPGETGEVILTDLHNLGMPFIRYQSGDLAIRKPPGRCACGRELPRLESVEGRVTETLRDGKGRKVNGLLFSIIFAFAIGAARAWQAIQHKDGTITLNIVAGPKWSEDQRRDILASCAKYLEAVPVTIALVDEIPLTKAGKRKIVIVES